MFNGRYICMCKTSTWYHGQTIVIVFGISIMRKNLNNLLAD